MISTAFQLEKVEFPDNANTQNYKGGYRLIPPHVILLLHYKPIYLMR